MSRRPRGFSLPEALIALVLMGVLAAVAYPSYTEQLQRSRRSDAWDALARLQLAQERHRSQHTQFADSVAQLALPPHSPARLYRVQVSGANAQGYTLEAAPLPHSPQARDPRCQRLRVVVVRGVLQREAFDEHGQDSTRRCFVA